MYIVGVVVAAGAVLGSFSIRRTGTPILALVPAAALLMVFLGTTAETAGAATAPVPLGTSANYAVLGGSTVTNTNNTTLEGSLGLWPGTSITGFPPGIVVAPGTTEPTTAAAQQAQSDLTVAYVDAAGRPVGATTQADLANRTLVAGVYSGPSKGALSLTGPLVLDGMGDRNAVFIFQTDSTLITASSSTVTLMNGAQECNVFWQVGSSATLGTDSVFVGNIMALTSITVNNGVTVRGRALARNGAVTLDNDTFSKPTCALTAPATTTTAVATTTTTVAGGTTTSTVAGGTTTSTVAGGTTTSTVAGGTTTSTVVGATATATGGATTTTTAATGGGTPTTARPDTPGQRTSEGPGVPAVVGPPRTGGAPFSREGFPWTAVVSAGLVAAAWTFGRVRRAHPQSTPPTER